MKSENEIEQEIAVFLDRLYWRRYRNHVGKTTTKDDEGKERTFSVGKPGTPDWTYRRTINGQRGCVQILHVECKAEGKKPTGEHGKRQLEQIALLNHLAEPACWANSLWMFAAWYAEQGFDVR